MTAPCLNCPDRKVGCKIDCERYAEFRKEIDERNRQLKADRDKRKMLNSYQMDARLKSKRKR